MPKAVSTTLYAIHEGKAYALTVQRANSKKWNRQLMFGAAGKPNQGETRPKAMIRELEEELKIKPKEILKSIGIGKAKPKTRESLDFSSTFHLVQVSFQTLQRTAKRINKEPGKYHELRSARIVQAKNLGKKLGLLQPHYKNMLPMIKHRLQKEKTMQRRRK